MLTVKHVQITVNRVQNVQNIVNHVQNVQLLSRSNGRVDYTGCSNNLLKGSSEDTDTFLNCALQTLTRYRIKLQNLRHF